VSRAGSQQRTLAVILGRLRPYWRSDAGLPARIEAILSGDRRLGSRDRRLYRELIYASLRFLPWVEPLLDTDPAGAARRAAWLAGDSPAIKAFRDEVAAGMPGLPAAVDEKARVLSADAELLSPAWLREECPGALSPPLRDVLLSRAPLWLRLQAADPGPILSEFESLGWAWRESGLCRGALLLPQGSDVTKTRAYLSGGVEVQDIGSQLILATVGVGPGGHWLDACAGAGGKTLQLAVLLGPGGRVTARDPRRAALAELAARAARAGLGDRLRVGDPSDPQGGFDAVLVDAPCTGSGTWRRAPHLRWVTAPGAPADAAAVQLRLLLESAPRVRPGGRLVYATCSICRSENESVVSAFLGARRDFAAEIPGKSLLPQEHDGDGFFVASLRRA
jgi:16S rRNA (cytosine967-C5)-methyltransferase